MTKARDAKCPKCRAYREMIWTPIEKATVRGLRVDRFVGLSMRCRICDFEIAEIGEFTPDFNADSSPAGL